jgi:hypothetical protein
VAVHAVAEGLVLIGCAYLKQRSMTDDGWTDQETTDPLVADDRNFYKVEKWTKDGTKVDRLLYAGNSLTKAHEIFAEAVKHRPRIRLTVRQRTTVLKKWPP